ncbi:hypothetical protein M9458_043720, partial [Cirrhinus mrigala]
MFRRPSLVPEPLPRGGCIPPSRRSLSHGVSPWSGPSQLPYWSSAGVPARKTCGWMKFSWGDI